ncbi:MAG: hypothetical protein R2941_22210 [Desulfobacterales bacterium]
MFKKPDFPKNPVFSENLCFRTMAIGIMIPGNKTSSQTKVFVQKTEFELCSSASALIFLLFEPQLWTLKFFHGEKRKQVLQQIFEARRCISIKRIASLSSPGLKLKPN